MNNQRILFVKIHFIHYNKVSSILDEGGNNMGFSRARTSEQKRQRIEEVVKATARLYDSVPYDDITFAAIAKETGFARSNLYIYFSSKEEILLELLARDFEKWVENLEEAFHVRKTYSLEEIATIWTDHLYQHKRLLNLLSILLTVLEKNVSVEALAKFKIESMDTQKRAHQLLSAIFPEASETELQAFLRSQLALAQGMYPMTELTEHQKKAVEQAGIDYVVPDFRDIYRPAVLKLFP
jgi:AcrR family transcriptional regulator